MDRAQGTIRIKWVRSGIGFSYRQKEMIRSLGLRRLNQIVERPDSPQIRGLVARIPHLVEVVSEAVEPARSWGAEYTILPPQAVVTPATPAEKAAPEAAEGRPAEAASQEVPEPMAAEATTKKAETSALAPSETAKAGRVNGPSKPAATVEKKAAKQAETKKEKGPAKSVKSPKSDEK